jgi:transposase-like protein
MADGVIEIVTGRERRRRWSIEDKLRMVRETHAAGACVKQVAARYDISAGLLFTWRRQVREGKLEPPKPPTFVPVHTLGASPPPAMASTARVEKHTRCSVAGQIEIELRDGSRVRVDGDVSLASLRRVIVALRG